MTNIKESLGGVCAPIGFRAAGVHCGIRKNKEKRDLSLIVSDCRAAAAAVYTQNLVKGAPLLVTRAHLADGYAQAIICNSGNANTCNANGVELAEQTASLCAQALGLSAADIVVASTGVIGQEMEITPFKTGIPPLVASLGCDSTAAVEGIMTTDTVKKQVAVEFVLDGHVCHIGGIAKGSGMIHPNMATMLSFLTTDVSVSPALLQTSLSADIVDSFNMVSVDGDTSTNDMVVMLANGMAGNRKIERADDPAYAVFAAALAAVTAKLSRMIAKDGEGATKLLECRVSGARDKEAARLVAKSVICSSLLKAAMFGCDANWGRVLCAIGYAGAAVDVTKVAVTFRSVAGEITVCENGTGVAFSEEVAKTVLSEKEIEILITLGDGGETAVAYGCDLSYEYVKINGEYRT